MIMGDRNLQRRMAAWACALTAALITSAIPVAVHASTLVKGRQTVVLLSGERLLHRRLPAFLAIGPGQFVPAASVQRACSSPGVRPESLLLYRPATGQCRIIEARGRIALRQHLHALTGRWSRAEDLSRVQSLPYIAIAPPADTRLYARTGCSCSSNTPPLGSVVCDAQTRTAGTAIGPITYLASDADGDALAGTFSYQRDMDAVQPGLPVSLHSSCTPAPGSLECTVEGTAPGPAGILQLNLSVSDGSASVPLQSLLEVLDPVASRIFADSFESLGCQ